MTADGRELGLLNACGLGWRRLASDEDLWDAMEIEEKRDWKLLGSIPAEIAVVDGDYFFEDDAAVIVLPRKRARAELVDDVARADSRVSPRVLLNGSHPLLVALESSCKQGVSTSSDLRRIFDLLIAAVVNEKAKGRRQREFAKIVRDLLTVAGLPMDTEAKFLS